MAKPLDELYFTWLYSQVGVVGRMPASRSHWHVLKLLYTKEFVWFVPNDDNRAEDGRELRTEFLETQQIDVSEDSHWMRLGCDMFELLLGVSRRLAFETDGTTREWFWVLMANLELDQYTDNTDVPEDVVNEVLEVLIWRNYSPDGSGGLFPLRRPIEDQRSVELWYQLSSYLQERE
jgi:hypothetical protein